MRKRSGRFFIISFAVLFTFISVVTALIASVSSLHGIGFIEFVSDGTVMLGSYERAQAARPPVAPPFTLPIVPVPTTPFSPKPPGEALSFAELYAHAAPSVAVVLAQTQTGRGVGTGIIVSPDGYIATNHHVVEGARSVTVILHDGYEYTAQVIGSDRLSDLAVLKIRADGLPAAEFGDSDMMFPGDPVAAIGNPLGTDLRSTITTGVISGVNRDITLEDASGEITMTVLQTNCAVNPGNSGGPLLNQYGQVIGIISAKIMGSSWQSVEGLGFAIPINSAAPLIDQIIQYGYVRGRPAIGITVDLNYNSSVAPSYGLPPGVRVNGVNELSDAYRKGLQAGDIITHINGETVSSIGEVNDIRNAHVAGDNLTLTVYRSGETLIITIRLMEEGEMRG
jgi:serine protease Do